MSSYSSLSLSALADWTSLYPDPGSHHYPQCRRGGVVALFFLPAGRISYDAKPEDEMPPGA